MRATPVVCTASSVHSTRLRPLTPRVPHASCEQNGAAIAFYLSKDIVLFEGSAISNCTATQVRSGTAAGRLPIEKPLAPRALHARHIGRVDHVEGARSARLRHSPRVCPTPCARRTAVPSKQLRAAACCPRTRPSLIVPREQ